MPQGIPEREDRRRELALWVLVNADMCAITPDVALDRFERAFVGPHSPPAEHEATEYFRLERVEDHLPEPSAWEQARDRVTALVTDYGDHAAQVDTVISETSPRWRIDRMPVIDRTLLRIGVVELLFSPPARPRATINGLIELAKRFGSETTPAFVNGILDQVRRDRGIPFT